MAHAGEPHGGNIDYIRHIIEADPWIFLPLIMLVIVLIPAIMYAVSKSFSSSALVALLLLFVIGTLSYAAAPILAIICITAGFVLALTLVFGGIAGG